MNVPRATVRLQFNRHFTFDHAAGIIDYLADLGISHIYASPIMAARPGSLHGYDVIDPNAVNPELGGMDALRRLSLALRARDMGLIIDIVPNHMAACAENRWWWDVLALGRDSRYANYFDIDWNDSDPDLKGKVLLPTLGSPLKDCLDRGELHLDMNQMEGGPVCRYFDQAFPINPSSASTLQSEAGRAALSDLLNRQNYRLVYWREAATRINWRRFFDINQLVALRMEDDAVFDDFHRLTLTLYRDGVIDGVRIDHVDGLADPKRYCKKLRASLIEVAELGPRPKDGPPYVVVEKILEHDEDLPGDWGIDGSTGYDFMDQVAAVLHDPRGEAALTALWTHCSGERRAFHALARAARRETVDRLFPKQTDMVVQLLRESRNRDGTEIDDGDRRAALIELLSAFRRYRLYGDAEGFSREDRAVLQSASDEAAVPLAPKGRDALQDIVESLSAAPADPRTGVAAPRARFQQLSATLAAKAVEDTAFYRYGRLISRNEVGGDPGRLAISPDEFHMRCKSRLLTFPRAMLATATHDHKRGEDNRARLAVLSEIAEEWSALVQRWTRRYQGPDPAIQAMLYQTIAGAWPLNFDWRSDDARLLFRNRISGWLIKALREAKRQTSWYDPDEGFEHACSAFLHGILDPDAGEGFLSEMQALVDRIAPAGALNALSQALLRLSVPGIPDLYQGTEFWDFSLVDPDNRDLVNFTVGQQALSFKSSPAVLMRDWRDGRVKQYTIIRALAFRKLDPVLFATGTYRPIPVIGPQSENVLAFLREAGSHAALVLAPRCGVALLGGHDLPLVPEAAWNEAVLDMPLQWSRAAAHNVILDRSVSLGERPRVDLLLADWPVGLFRLTISE